MEYNLRLEARNFLRNLLFEDDSMADIKAYSDGIKHHGIKQRPISKYIETLANKFNLNFVKVLGAGSNGIALLTDNGLVVKITGDKSEAVEANKYFGKDSVHLPKVYKVLKIRVGDNEELGFDYVYVLIKDYIPQNKSLIKLFDELKKRLETINIGFNRHLKVFIQEIAEGITTNEQIDEFRKKIIESESLKDNKKTIWFFDQLVEMMYEMRKVHIHSFDFNGENLGMKNKKLVYLDVGFGDWFGDTGHENNHYDAMVAEEENPLTEDDFQNLQAHADGEHDGIYKKSISRYLNVIKNKLHLNPVKLLGKGNFGIAFLTSDNKTVKITTDKSEVVEAKKYMGKNVHHIPNVYNVLKLKVDDNNDVYVIVKEFILQNKKYVHFLYDLQRKWEEQMVEFVKRFNEEFPVRQEYFVDIVFKEEISFDKIEKFLNFSESLNQPLVTWYARQTYDLLLEIMGLDIDSTDIKPENLGIRNRQLIYFDIGDGDSVGDGWIEKKSYDAEVTEVFNIRTIS